MYRWTKVVLVILVLMMAAAVSTPAVQPTEAKTASGTFDYIFEVNFAEEVGGKLILYALEHEVWTGTFQGIAHAVFIVIVHESGLATVDLLSTFTGTVNGKEGTVVTQLVGAKPSLAEGDWQGHWVIIRGIGELEDLRGGGTWGGPGFEVLDPGTEFPDIAGTRPDIWYEGTIHFDDDDDDDWDDDWDEDDWDDDEDEEDDDADEDDD